MNEDIIGLFDMDGTLFDYTGKLREDLRPLMGPNEEEPQNLWDESLPHIKARRVDSPGLFLGYHFNITASNQSSLKTPT